MGSLLKRVEGGHPIVNRVVRTTAAATGVLVDLKIVV
jgi:hypothetical protein